MFSKNLAKYAFETYITWLFLLDIDMLVDRFSKVVNSPIEIDCSMTSQWGLCQQIFVNNCKQPMFLMMVYNAVKSIMMAITKDKRKMMAISKNI